MAFDHKKFQNLSMDVSVGALAVGTLGYMVFVLHQVKPIVKRAYHMHKLKKLAKKLNKQEAELIVVENSELKTKNEELYQENQKLIEQFQKTQEA